MGVGLLGWSPAALLVSEGLSHMISGWQRCGQVMGVVQACAYSRPFGSFPCKKCKCFSNFCLCHLWWGLVAKTSHTAKSGCNEWRMRIYLLPSPIAVGCTDNDGRSCSLFCNLPSQPITFLVYFIWLPEFWINSLWRFYAFEPAIFTSFFFF